MRVTNNHDQARFPRPGVCRSLMALARDQVTPGMLAKDCLDAIARHDASLGAFVDVRPELVRGQAQSAQQRRREGVIGRLDGIPVAVKDNFDIGGYATRVGLPRPEQAVAAHDAQAVARLRASGAILIGKTCLDEGALGAVGDNPHGGPVHHPERLEYVPGGSSAGSAVAVASGMALAAIGSDSLGSIRIPASYCGLYGFKPTHGEISTVGLTTAARRLDCVGILAAEVEDLGVLLHVLSGYDVDDIHSRRRRVALDLPDWEPGRLRCGLLADLAELNVKPEVCEVFQQALASLQHSLGRRRQVDFSDWPFAATRRAGLLLMEVEMLHTFAADLKNSQYPVSARFRKMLDFARRKSAGDYAQADRVLDAARLKARRLFAQVDVLVMPTTPQGAFPLDAPVPDNQADLTSFASLAGCPAVSLPMGRLPDGLPIGMQMVGPPGSDLRLLELAGICAACLDVE